MLLFFVCTARVSFEFGLTVGSTVHLVFSVCCVVLCCVRIPDRAADAAFVVFYFLVQIPSPHPPV